MRIIITAGGTREYIDPVRFISNASTGKMGYSLGRAAIKAGHKVTLITAPTSLRPPKKAKTINVETSAEMLEALKANFDKCDCLIMAAAVSDYRPLRRSKTKIKKSMANLTIKLKPTSDILKWASRNKTNQKIIGFALEDKAIKSRAEKKLKSKKLDMIVANTPTAIAADISTVYIKTTNTDWLTIENKPKTTIAKKIITLIQEL